MLEDRNRPIDFTFDAMQLPAPHIIPISETDWLLQFNTGLSVTANQQLHALADAFRQHFGSALTDAVVAYESLLLRFQQPQPQMESFWNEWWGHWKHTSSSDELKLIEIPVCYDTALANDLEAMSHQSGLSIDTIVQLHSVATYHIYMLGFLPGFAYMGSVDERIALPRKLAPVPVKAGAVGIAGTQTGIYPSASPGGWNIVGYTPLQLFDASREPACLLKLGQQVRFVPISLSDFKRLQAS